MTTRGLTKSNSAVCQRCNVRHRRDEMKQGGGFNNYECIDKAECAKAAQSLGGVETGELRQQYVWSEHGKGRHQ